MSITYDDPTLGRDDIGPAPAQGGSDGAARLLEIAASNAEQLLAEAHAEAGRVRIAARQEAEAVLADARREAAVVRADLEATRGRIRDDIAALKHTRQEHRTRMREHLRTMLVQVEAFEVI